MCKNPKIIKLILTIFLIISASVYVGASPPADTAISPDKAMQMLKEGNSRFASGKCIHPHSDSARIAETSKNGQHPFATILACSDSRVPAELIFDQGIGDIFVVRVAGNICNTDEAGSIEYSTGHLGTRLLVVLGHTDCGAVAAAVDGAQLHGNIAKVVENIQVAAAKTAAANPKLSRDELLAKTIEANCRQSIENLLKISPESRELIRDGRLKIVAAIYNISTGEVTWLGD